MAFLSEFFLGTNRNDLEASVTSLQQKAEIKGLNSDLTAFSMRGCCLFSMEIDEPLSVVSLMTSDVMMLTVSAACVV